MCSDPNTISSLLRRMEKSGLLKRHVHESDKRAHRIRLQRKGRHVYRKARPVALQLQAEVLGALKDSQRAQLLEALDIIAKAFDEDNR